MNHYRRRLGDRKDGRRIRTLPAFNNFIPYIMPSRNDALVQYEESLEITEAETELFKLRSKGYPGIGIMHVIIAVYLQCLAQMPQINRFVAGRRIFARNSIEVIMAVKRNMTADAPETMIKVLFEPTDTIFDVYTKMNEKIREAREAEEGNGTEQAAGILCRAPRPLLRLTISMLRMLDYLGLLPRALTDVSPFHGSVIITNLGSIGIGPVYHHIYNFGTLPVFIALGAKHTEIELDSAGKPVRKKYVDTKIVLDERITDGFSYAKFFRKFRYLFLHPEQLEQQPEAINEDIR